MTDQPTTCPECGRELAPAFTAQGWAQRLVRLHLLLHQRELLQNLFEAAEAALSVARPVGEGQTPPELDAALHALGAAVTALRTFEDQHAG